MKDFILWFEDQVKKTIEEYALVSRDDKILVACSGGKDSMTVLYLLKKFGYRVEGLIIDLLIGEWSQANLDNAQRFCDEQGIKLHVVSVRDVLGGSMCYIRSKIGAEKKLTTCAVCGVIKRWLLNKKSRELGADKVATGHNLDDQVETLMMNLLKNNIKLNAGQQPVTGVVKDDKFVPRIKPLFFCLNKEVRKYSELKKFPVLYDNCPCASGVFRKEIREELTNLEEKFPDFKENMVRNFLKILSGVKNEGGAIAYCEKCDEVSRKKLCKFCDLMSVLEREKFK